MAGISDRKPKCASSEKDFMKKGFKAGTIILISLMGAFLAAGCGSKEGKKTKEAIQSVESGDFDAALTLLDEAEAAGEEAVYLYRGKGLAYMGQNRYEEAAENFKEALASDGSIPGSVDYDINYYIGVCYYKLGQYEDAKARFDSIIGIKSKAVDAYVERGTVLLALNQPEDAKKDFDTAVELTPKDYGLAIDIYCALREAGYEAEGDAYLQKAVDSGDKKMPDYDKGRLYFYLEDYSSSRDYLEKAKGNGNSSEELILLLGQCYENLNDRTYALTVYQSYLTASQSKAVYNQMGICYANSGDYENALATFQTGLGLSDATFDQELKFNEIVTYEKLGDHIKAKELCTEYLQEYPQDEAAQREYLFLKTR